MKFPKLPKNQKPTYFYKAGDYFIAVVVSDDAIREYAWDGIAMKYNQFFIYDRIEMEVETEDKSELH